MTDSTTTIVLADTEEGTPLRLAFAAVVGTHPAAEGLVVDGSGGYVGVADGSGRLIAVGRDHTAALRAALADL